MGMSPENHLKFTTYNIQRGPSEPSKRFGLLRGRGETSAGKLEPHSSEAKERAVTVETARRVKPKDYETILHWSADPEVRGHLSPAPKLPSDWNDNEQILECVLDLHDYYTNAGEPSKITPIAVVNERDDIEAALTIRWRGDPFVPLGRRIAAIERFIVKPESQGQHVGTKTLATALEHAFNARYYGANHDQPADEVRAWTMEDEEAGDWRRNVNLMRKFGFQPIPDSNWPDYKQKRGLEDDGRGNATWWKVKKEWYEAKKMQDLSITPVKTVELS